jgi:hypothetical protein
MIASSEDHEHQSIDNTLNSSQFSFWSSVGTGDPENVEFLDYELVDSVCIVSSVRIKPYLAHYQRGLPCYAPVFISVVTSMNSDFRTVLCRSEKYYMKNEPSLQQFFPHYMLYGKYIRIYLHGHSSTQQNDKLYYTALERVEVFGMSLGGLKLIAPAIATAIGYTQEYEACSRYQEWSIDKEALKKCCYFFKNDQLSEIVSLYLKSSTNSLLRQQEGLEYLETRFPLKFQGFFESYIARFLNENIGIPITEAEGLKIGKITSETLNSNLLEQLIIRELIECTITLGDMFYLKRKDSPDHLAISHEIFCSGGILDRMFETGLHFENYRMALQVLVSTSESSDIPSVLKFVYSTYSIKVFSTFSLILCRFMRANPNHWDSNFIELTIKNLLGLSSDAQVSAELEIMMRNSNK